MIERRPALGKGLSALIPDVPEAPRTGAIEVDVDLLAPNDQQPRIVIDESKLEELAASIRANGIIQPILVRRTGSTYRIIAGERRWRAAQRAGLLKVPVVVRDVPDGAEQQMLELALVENLQREDLQPVDEALAYQRLVDEFGLTQDEDSGGGRKGPDVGRELPPAPAPSRRSSRRPRGRFAVDGTRPGAPGAAGGSAQRQAAREVIARSLSVRDTEALVKKMAVSGLSAPVAEASSTPDVHTRAAEDRLRFALGTKVRIIRRRSGDGTIEISFRLRVRN